MVDRVGPDGPAARGGGIELRAAVGRSSLLSRVTEVGASLWSCLALESNPPGALPSGVRVGSNGQVIRAFEPNWA